MKNKGIENYVFVAIVAIVAIVCLFLMSNNRVVYRDSNSFSSDSSSENIGGAAINKALKTTVNQAKSYNWLQRRWYGNPNNPEYCLSDEFEAGSLIYNVLPDSHYEENSFLSLQSGIMYAGIGLTHMIHLPAGSYTFEVRGKFTGGSISGTARVMDSSCQNLGNDDILYFPNYWATRTREFTLSGSSDVYIMLIPRTNELNVVTYFDYVRIRDSSGSIVFNDYRFSAIQPSPIGSNKD